jgi:hypothetical protein
VFGRIIIIIIIIISEKFCNFLDCETAAFVQYCVKYRAWGGVIIKALR